MGATQATEGSVQSANVGVKTIQVADVNGNTVYLQVAALSDGEGNIFDPLTETTGRAILNELRTMNAHLRKMRKLP